MAAPATIDEFIELGCKAGLLERATITTYCARLQQNQALPPAPDQFAQLLIRDGYLTNFQATLLLGGRWRGFVLANKYRLLDSIGAGGMGTVYLCEHLRLKRRVAVKVLPTAHAEDPAVLKRFYREARAVAALSHPNIVRAHDIDQDDKLHFLVMEYVEGSDLQSIVKQHGAMDATRAVHYVSQAALGLQHAHEAGLVHRDVKPANLLLDRQGTIKILDLGLARFFHDDQDELTQKHDAGAVLGTADFLAPEQAMESHSVDIRADIYSLGATFYYLLAGHAPFHDKNIAQKLVCHQMREPPAIQSLRPDVPDAIVKILNRLMAKKAANRFQQPVEIAIALQPWTQQAINAPPDHEMPASESKSATSIDVDADGSTKISSPQSPSGLSGATTVRQPATAQPLSSAVIRTESAPIVNTESTSSIRQFARANQRPLLITIAAVIAVTILIIPLVAWAILQSGGSPLQNKNATKSDSNPPAPGQSLLTYVAAPARAGEIVNHFTDNKGMIAAVQFSPDGKRLLSADKNGDVRLRDVATGKQIANLKRPGQAWTAARFSPDGRTVFAAGVNGHILSWLPETKTSSISIIAKTKSTNCLAVAPDGNQLASAGVDHLLHLWDLKKSKIIPSLRGHSQPIFSIAYAPDGKRIISAGAADAIFLWDVAGGKRIQQFSGARGATRSVAFSADGRHFVSAGDDGIIRLWSADSGCRLREMRGHRGKINAVVFSPSGRHVLSGGDDGTARIWDAATARQVYQWRNEKDAVTSLVCTPDGMRLAAGFRSAGVRLYALPRFVHSEPVGLLQVLDKHQGAVEAVAISKDGSRIVTGGKDKMLRLWDGERGTVIRSFAGHTNTISSVAFSADAQQIFSAGQDKTIRHWDVATGEVLRIFKGHRGAIERIELSADDRQILSAGHDGQVRLWNVFNGRTVRLFKDAGKPAWTATWSPDRKYIVALGGRGVVHFWEARKGKEVRKFNLDRVRARQLFFIGKGDKFLTDGDGTQAHLWQLSNQAQPTQKPLDGHDKAVTCVAVSADGRFALTGDQGGKVRLWDLQNRRAIRTFSELRGSVRAVAFSENGSFAVAGGADGSACLWRLPAFCHAPRIGTATILAVSTQHIDALAQTPDGKQCLLGGPSGIIQICHMDIGTMMPRFSEHKNKITNICYSPDGKWALSTSAESLAYLWQVSTGKLAQTFKGHTGNVNAAVFSPDGRYVFTAGSDSTARLWDAATGAEMQQFRGHEAAVNAVAFSPNGNTLITASADKSVRVWQTETGKLLNTLAGHTDEATTVAVSPDGLLALSGGKDKLLCLWDLSKGKLIRKFTGHKQPVRCLAISADGQYALSGGDDNKVCFWNLHSRRLIRQFNHHGFAVTGVAFTPDGRHAVSASRDRTLRRWALPMALPW